MGKPVKAMGHGCWAVICKEAGGTVTNFKGEIFTPKSNNILASTPSLSKQLVGLINYK